MTPSPLLSSQNSKLEEQSGDISSEVSVASSSGCMHDITLSFDPDSVDFEPLMVSGTGKILTYHSESYHGQGGISSINSSMVMPGNSSVNSSMITSGISSINSSMVTPIIRNGRLEMHYRAWKNSFFKRTSSSRFVQMLSLVLLAAFMVMGVLSWVATDANSYPQQLQTTVSKTRAIAFHPESNNAILHQRMMDVRIAASSGTQVFWVPHLGHVRESSDNLLLENSMAIVSQCFSQSVFNLHVDEMGSYRLEPANTLQPTQLDAQNTSSTMVSLQHNSPSRGLSMTVFTPNFRLAAMELFDDFSQGAFIAMVNNPIEIYLEQYTNQHEEAIRAAQHVDNPIVRHLAGIADENRDVNDSDYDVAKQVLMSKFIIGSCDNPSETLRRLVQTIGTSADSSTIGSEGCIQKRKTWNQTCRKMKEVGEQNRENQHNKQILQNIKSKHHYDIMMYEESKNIFLEQNALFE